MIFKQQSPQTKIRLIGHSLGSELILSTLQVLAKKSYTDIVESVHFFGASVENNVATYKKFGKILQKTVKKKIINYYSPKDEVLHQSQQDGSAKNPLGLLGASGKNVPKFKQKRVFPKNHRFASYSAVLNTFP